jgi:hypothetical protein
MYVFYQPHTTYHNNHCCMYVVRLKTNKIPHTPMVFVVFYMLLIGKHKYNYCIKLFAMFLIEKHTYNNVLCCF